MGHDEGASPNQTSAAGGASAGGGLFQLFETAFHFFDRVLSKLHGDPRLTILWGFAVLLFVSLIAILSLNRPLAGQSQWLQAALIALVILALVFLLVFTIARIPGPRRERRDTVPGPSTPMTPADRKAYERGHGWAAVTIGGDERTLNIATLVALETLRRGGDATAAMEAARASVGSAALPSPLVTAVVDVVRSGQPAPRLVHKRSRSWIAVGGCAATLFLLTVALIIALAVIGAIGAAISRTDSSSAADFESKRVASILMQGTCLTGGGCPVTPALAGRLAVLFQQGIDWRCRCPQPSHYLVIGVTQTATGGIAHVRIDLGNGLATGIDVVVVQRPEGWLATDLQCTVTQGSSTSIFNDPVAPCPTG